jgi:hypothetical protein
MTTTLEGRREMGCGPLTLPATSQLGAEARQVEGWAHSPVAGEDRPLPRRRQFSFPPPKGRRDACMR